MNGSEHEEPEDEMHAITEVAILYYLEKLTQAEVGARLGISRMQVRRLLQRGHDVGVVQVRVRRGPNDNPELERELAQRFNLRRALVATDHADAEEQRAAVARLVANHLSRTAESGEVIAVGMGRNVGAVAEYAEPAPPRERTFVCAIGGSLRGGQLTNPDHICQRLVDRFGGQSEALYAPARVEDIAMRDAMMQLPGVRETLDLARHADRALVGIGDLSEDSNMVRMGWFSPQEVAGARLSGTVGDLMGYDFIDIHGRRVSAPIQDRIVGLRMEDLAGIREVIAIASEGTKSAAILGALRTGVIDTLATSAANAHSILKLADATRIREPAPLVTYR